MLHIYTSNRLEYLIQVLASTIQSNPLPPLTPEIIVVQNQGMERWVSMELAQRLGVWANASFPFPNTILWRIFKETLGYLPDTSQFERDVLVWSLLDILPELLEESEFTELKGYLHDDEHGIKLFQLADKLAHVFDEYLVHRPTWVGEWEHKRQPPELEKESQAEWQAMLWRELVKRYGTQHRAKVRADFFREIRHHTPLFPRISVFGISALPAFHVEVLAELGQTMDVFIFLHNPCQEYWGHIVSDNEIAHKTLQARKVPEHLLYLEKGNTLLASMGKMVRDFMDMLNEYPHMPHEHFEKPAGSSLLSCIQSDILYLRDRHEGKKTQIDDQSIKIQSCHSAMREVEILHDQLLALFEENPELLPKDVLVMMPNIEIYAPFIEAVFDTTPVEAKKIPYSIADRSLRGESVLIDTFFAILELSQSRFSVTQVLAILETEAVQKRFKLNEQELEFIRTWIQKTGIRWGMNKADKARHNVPAFEENTWQSGLDRLLLGYALPKKGDQLFHGILPFDALEGNDTLILGKLVAFIEKLFQCVQSILQPRTVTDWVHFLREILEDFLETDNENTKVQEIRTVLNDLIKNTQLVDFNTPINRHVILEYLKKSLIQKERATHFITGSVSFCAMLPMRSIPFKIICLLGMNDQDYPKPSIPLSFDLIAKKPKRGDRLRRQNDRYLFLEALLSARQYLYISYVGHNIRDNTVIPPSVLVSELLDYIDKGFLSTHPIVTHHPLQAFSPRYFNGTDTQLFSFSQDYCTASAVLLGEHAQKSQILITTPLPDPEPIAEWKTIDIKYLSRFFKNPTEFLLKERLGIRLTESKELINETEPFEIGGLDAYQFNQTLVQKSLEGVDLQQYHEVAKAEGILPHGNIGAYVYGEHIKKIQPFLKRVQKSLQDEKLDAIIVQKTMGDMHITGRLGRLWKNHRVQYRFAKLKAKDHIDIWIYHLILNSFPELPHHSLLIGEDKSWEYQPVHNSEQILEELLTVFYWQGLHTPLHFFPSTSLKFVEALQDKGKKKGKSEAEAFAMAEKEWEKNDMNKHNIIPRNDYEQLCFGELPLSEQEFIPLARKFFDPLLAHRKAYVT